MISLGKVMNVDKTKILIYELNEVPRKLFELYVEKYPNSAFSYFKKKGLVLDTFTKDDGELHPWSTWPTVHRGVYNFDHEIRFINQDLNKKITACAINQNQLPNI